MKTPPQNDSEAEDLRPVTQANKRSKTEEKSEVSIPVDLIVEIFLRLPAKSIAKCRCVSKRWASILRFPYFTEMFLTRSSSRRQLLFACIKDGHVFFFSSPQTRNLDDENSSLILTANYHMKIPSEFSYETRMSAIRGLVFIRLERGFNGRGHVSVICNPSTGQSLILPKVKSRRRIGVRSYFGYDPIEKQYKVLSMTWLIYGSRFLVSEEHQVLTLGGTGEPSWRKIECSTPHTLNGEYHHICINGVLYYPAERSSGDFIIVCFDLRSEKFRFVKDTDTYTQLFRCAPLINYNGKLASLGPEGSIDGSCKSIKLRVLEDVEKQEWSEHIYLLPALWKNIVVDTYVRFVGVTPTNELVFSSSSLQCLFYSRRVVYHFQRCQILLPERQTKTQLQLLKGSNSKEI